jgi:hypothetical protein
VYKFPCLALPGISISKLVRFPPKLPACGALLHPLDNAEGVDFTVCKELAGVLAEVAVDSLNPTCEFLK